MKQPKKLRPGQVWAKINTDRNGVRRVISRTILAAFHDVIWYTPRRAWCRCRLVDWWKWSKNADCVRNVEVPCIACNGHGSYQEGGTLSQFIKCATCRGTGRIKPTSGAGNTR